MIYRNHANLRDTFSQHRISKRVCARMREPGDGGSEHAFSAIITLPLVSIFRKWFEIMSNSVSLLII